MYALTFAVYGTGSVVCHQLPERSFHVWGAQMPVCARCAGIYLGAAIAALVAAAPLKRRPPYESDSAALVGAARLERHPANEPAFPVPAGHRFSGAALAGPNARVALALAAVPTLATLLYEWTTGDTPANWIRALAGIGLGAAVATVIEREVN
jgi:hypothetical protein